MGRFWRVAVLAAVAAMVVPQVSRAEEWPARPIRVVVGFPAGQATDIVARLVSQKLTEMNGWNVVVDNRPGQGGSLGAAMVAKSPPDGYTLLFSATAPLATNPNLYKEVGYDSLKDFTPISLTTNLPYVLIVSPKLDVSSVKELIARAKAKPGTMNYATPGNGTTHHLITGMFARAAGLELTHVPYKGSPQALTDLLSGQIDFMFETALFATPHIREGEVRALAVSTKDRSSALPDIPTLAEQGFEGFDASAWLGMVAPANLPDPILRRLNGDLTKILTSDDMRERLKSMNAETLTSTPEQFKDYIATEYVKWGRAVREVGVKID
jgi:tripartite-type tricarboxylate transporter receptor subunit TctC